MSAQQLRRPGSSTPAGYTPTHGHLYQGMGATRYCDMCKCHRPMAGKGWKKFQLVRWACPVHQEQGAKP